MNFIRYIKAALNYAAHWDWVDAAKWTADDAAALAAFMGTPTGERMKALFVNAVLSQQATALNARLGRLPYEAGYSAGQKGTVAFIESLADAHNFTERGEQDADPATNQPES